MTEKLPANTVAVFATLCGATVAMTRTRTQDADAFNWVCLGCGDGTRYSNRHKHYVIPQANDHAGTCRSKTLPTT